jgi:AraC-like DNA-binding protein
MSPSKTIQLKTPVIVKTSETELIGVRSFELSRCAIGYILSGSKNIYIGDTRREAHAGDIIFLNKGTHFIENVPDKRRPFEQIVFFYKPEELGRIVSQLSFNHKLDIRVKHSCAKCYRQEHVVSHGWNTLKNFFGGVEQHLKEGLYSRDYTAEMLKFTELIYHIISHSESCIRTRVLNSTDPEKEFFEKIAYDYIFSNVTLKELAIQNNRSLTALKKAFTTHFNEPPHRWVTHQRLMNARLMLISTNKTVSQIADECYFTNNSHFIRLFHREYGVTPALFRLQHHQNRSKQLESFENEVETAEIESPKPKKTKRKLEKVEV